MMFAYMSDIIAGPLIKSTIGYFKSVMVRPLEPENYVAKDGRWLFLALLEPREMSDLKSGRCTNRDFMSTGVGDREDSELLEWELKAVATSS
jgi:hypothetical protein